MAVALSGRWIDAINLVREGNLTSFPQFSTDFGKFFFPDDQNLTADMMGMVAGAGAGPKYTRFRPQPKKYYSRALLLQEARLFGGFSFHRGSGFDLQYNGHGPWGRSGPLRGPDGAPGRKPLRIPPKLLPFGIDLIKATLSESGIVRMY